MSHMAGTKPYARYRQEERAAHPERLDPDRMHMFRVTHTRRDWLFVDATSADRMAQMEMCISQRPEGSDSSTGLNATFTKVMDVDRHGRVHTYGAGVTPTTFCAVAAAAETDHWRRATTDAEARTTPVASRLTTEMDVLQRQMLTMQQHMDMPPSMYSWEDTDATQPPDDIRS